VNQDIAAVYTLFQNIRSSLSTTNLKTTSYQSARFTMPELRITITDMPFLDGFIFQQENVSPRKAAQPRLLKTVNLLDWPTKGLNICSVEQDRH
jgi:hypothetical protein